MGWKQHIGPWLEEAICGAGAYVATRWIWAEDNRTLAGLPMELLTFFVLYLLLLLLVRGRKHVRRGKRVE